jgi:hypothetical protein
VNKHPGGHDAGVTPNTAPEQTPGGNDAEERPKPPPETTDEPTTGHTMPHQPCNKKRKTKSSLPTFSCLVANGPRRFGLTLLLICMVSTVLHLGCTNTLLRTTCGTPRTYGI